MIGIMITLRYWFFMNKSQLQIHDLKFILKWMENFSVQLWTVMNYILEPIIFYGKSCYRTLDFYVVPISYSLSVHCQIVVRGYVETFLRTRNVFRRSWQWSISHPQRRYSIIQLFVQTYGIWVAQFRIRNVSYWCPFSRRIITVLFKQFPD